MQRGLWSGAITIHARDGRERAKRRTRAIGAFPDRARALRLITAAALRTTSIWHDRIDLDMSLLDDNHVAAA